jgi:hypothetical protein
MNRDAMARFATGLKAIETVPNSVTSGLRHAERREPA